MPSAKKNVRTEFPYEIWASITERGQVTIPAEVRKALGLSKPGKLIFRIEDGAVVLKRPRFSSVDEITGSIPALKKPRPWREMKQIVADEIAEDYRRKMIEGNA